MNNKKIIFSMLWLCLFGSFGSIQKYNSQTRPPIKQTTPQNNTSTSNERQSDAPSARPEKSPLPTSEDFYSAGQNIEIKPEGVKGDVAVAGANVKISGDVQGYLMTAGANISINAPVGNDLWAAGANIVVNAPVADNAMLAGSSVVLEDNATIGRDARIAAGSIEVKSRIVRHLNISAANAQISSEIGGNVEAYVENLTLGPNAVVRGNLVVYSPNEPVISPQAQVLGRVDYHRTESRQSSSSSTIGNWFGNWFLSFLWMAVLGLIMVWFSPVWTQRVAEMLKKETGKSFLVGLTVMLLVPLAIIILLFTVIGLPLAVVLGALSLVGFMLSGAFVSYLVGDWLLNQLKRWQTSNVLKIVFGALIVTLVMSLPWVGGLAKLAVLFFGFGSFLLERRDLFRQLRGQGLA